MSDNSSSTVNRWRVFYKDTIATQSTELGNGFNLEYLADNDYFIKYLRFS